MTKRIVSTSQMLVLDCQIWARFVRPPERQHNNWDLAIPIEWFCGLLIVFILYLSLFASGNLLWADSYIDTRQPGLVSPKLVYQWWKRSSDVDDLPDKYNRTVQQIAIPLFLSAPISRRTRLYLTQTSTFSTSGDSDVPASRPDLRMDSFGDTQMKVSHVTAHGRLLLTGGLQLPLGNNISDGNDSEADISRTLYSDLLELPVMRSGEGFNISTGGVWGQRVGRLSGVSHTFSVSSGLSFLYRGSYETGGIDRWKPANELRWTGGFNRLTDRTDLYSSLTVTKFFSGRADPDLKINERYLLRTNFSYSPPDEKFSMTVNGIASFLTAAEGYRWPKNIILGRFVFRYEPTFKYTPYALLEARFIPDDAQEGKARLFTLGGGVQLHFLKEAIEVDVGFKYSTGREHVRIGEEPESVKVGIRGLGLSASVSRSF